METFLESDNNKEKDLQSIYKTLELTEDTQKEILFKLDTMNADIKQLYEKIEKINVEFFR